MAAGRRGCRAPSAAPSLASPLDVLGLADPGAEVGLEVLGQLRQVILYPAAPVLKGTASECVVAAQECPTRAAGDAVVVGSRFETDE